MTFVGKKENFKELVLDSKIPVLVDFWAPWCAPCQRSKPILEKLALDVDGLAKVVLVNVDEEPELAEKYEILSIPTLALFKDGNVKDYKVGVFGINILKDFLDL